MSIFEPSTPATESPEIGHEEVAAEEQQEMEQVDQDLQNEAGQEVETEEEQEEAPSEEEHGELLAGKYQTPEDLVNGYYNLAQQVGYGEDISNMTVEELSHAYKNLEREFHASRQNSTPPQGYGEQSDPNDVFWESFRDDPIGTLQTAMNYMAQQQIAPLYQERATERLSQNLNKLSQDYKQLTTKEGMTALRGKVAEIAQDFGNNSITDNPSPRVLKMAAEELWGDSKSQLYQKAKAQGKEEALNNIRAKQGLAAPSGAKPKETPKTPEDEIADSIVAAGRRGGIFG